MSVTGETFNGAKHQEGSPHALWKASIWNRDQPLSRTTMITKTDLYYIGFQNKKQTIACFFQAYLVFDASN
jgi:hypothetical protein